MTELERIMALQGPWKAVISDDRGNVYDTLANARLELGASGQVEISVRRGSALPDEDDDYLPVALIGDVAYVIAAYLVEDAPELLADVRLVQAQAAAEGLNAAAAEVSR